MHRLKYLACGLALLAAACGSNAQLTAPTTTTNLTQDFTDATNGPLTPHGSQTFTFATLAAGQVSVQLISLNPDGPNGQTVGLLLGVLDTSGGCQSVVHNDRVSLSSTVVASADLSRVIGTPPASSNTPVRNEGGNRTYMTARHRSR